MKSAVCRIGLFAFVGWLLPVALAQETTVTPPSGGVATPSASLTVPSLAATGTVSAAKAAKSGSLGAFFNMGEGASATNGGMEISSDRGEVDYQEMVVAFDGNVHVVDPKYDLKCERMLIFLEGSNQIKRIIANGKVVATQPGRQATGDRAVYEHATGAITMTGNPAVVTRGNDRVVWPTIIVYLNDQRILMEGGGRFSLSPETMKKGDAKP